jgi:hypothetical protein
VRELTVIIIRHSASRHVLIRIDGVENRHGEIDVREARPGDGRTVRGTYRSDNSFSG